MQIPSRIYRRILVEAILVDNGIHGLVFLTEPLLLDRVWSQVTTSDDTWIHCVPLIRVLSGLNSRLGLIVTVHRAQVESKVAFELALLLKAGALGHF